MPRDLRTERLPRTAGRLPSERVDVSEAEAPALLALFARSERLTDVLPFLHEFALDATQGICSLLFERNPRNGTLQATSGYGLSSLTADPWTPGEDEGAVVAAAFTRGEPTLVVGLERQMPDLAARLGLPIALLVPLARANETIGLLAIGFDAAPEAGVFGPAVAQVPDAFVAAIDLFRLRQNQHLQQDVRALLDEFAASLSQTMDVTACLEQFCQGATRLFAADRASVWIHDRRARHLVLQASSDAGYVVGAAHVALDDPQAPAASALRRTRAELVGDGEPLSTVTVPLRGRRRALGTLVFDGVRVETGGELDCLDRADEIGRQLSSAIETTQLLDDVLRARRELEHIFDSIGHLIVVSDRDGRITHVNEAFASRLAATREWLVNRPLAESVGSDLAEWLADLERDPPLSGEPRTTEIVDGRLGGPLLIAVTDLLDHDRQRIGHVLLARDLTRQTKLEAEREELRRQLTRSEKLVALGQFVAGIAHELNNPLQSVLGHLELLRSTGAFPRPLRADVQTIYREADRAAKIVRNLLAFAGARRIPTRPVSVNPLMQRAVSLRQGACKAQGIEIVRHYGERLPRVKSDPLLLHQVFVNMLMNAEQAIAPTGLPGRIEITTACADAGARIVITIRDNGPGIAAEAMSRIFEPFYTTKEVGQGTGLGLAIAYGIIQDHGGRIVVANHNEGGAIFSVELPSASSA